MKKSEIQLKGDLPAVNVKIRGSFDFTDERLAAVADRCGGNYTDKFLAWWHSLDEDTIEHVTEWRYEEACELGWGNLRFEAEIIWPDRKVEVWAKGRSGGWAVVDGLPPVETWNAVMVSKWASFVRFAHEQVKDIPYQTAALIIVNFKAAVLPQIDRETADAAAAQLPVQLVGED